MAAEPDPDAVAPQPCRRVPPVGLPARHRVRKAPVLRRHHPLGAEARRQQGLHHRSRDRDVRAGRRGRHRIVRAGLTPRTRTPARALTPRGWGQILGGAAGDLCGSDWLHGRRSFGRAGAGRVEQVPFGPSAHSSAGRSRCRSTTTSRTERRSRSRSCGFPPPMRHIGSARCF
jgi:hypothetical protein